MKQTVVLIACLVASQVSAQYGPPPTQGKKHRTTTTTTETPGSISNEISGPFPITDSGSYSFPPSSPSLPGSTVVTGNNYWWQGPDSPFKPGSQPPIGCTGAACGSPLPKPPPPSSGGCGGPAGCTGVGTDPRPSPTEPPSKPVDISQNPFLSSAILGKPIQQSPQGCQGTGGVCHPSSQGSSPSHFPGAPSGTSQYPGQPQPQPGGPAQYPEQPGSFPGQGTQPTQYPEQPHPGRPTQYPGQPGSFPGQGTQPTQYPEQPHPGRPTQYPGQPGSFPGQGTQPTQYPEQPQPGRPTKYPGQPAGSSPFPGQGTGPTQYPGQPQPGGLTQYPGQPAESSPFPGDDTGPIHYPGQTQPSRPTQYPGQPEGHSPYPGQGTGPTQYPEQLQPGRPTQHPEQPAGSSPFPGQGTGQHQPGGQPQHPGQPAESSSFPGQDTGLTQYPGQPQPGEQTQHPGQPAGSSPFPGQGTGLTQYPGQHQPQGPTQYPAGQYPGQPSGSSPYAGQPSGHPSVPLRPQCSIAGHACVHSSECVGGVITPKGMRQMRDPKVKECIPGLQACCRFPPGAGDIPFTPTPPAYTPQKPYTGPLNTTPFPGCAAALKCVPESFCTAEGVMSDTPVHLTRDQVDNRVPLTECQNLETGIIGKCCRDPNYKDPWPAGMMMKNPGEFDDGQYHGEGSGPDDNIGPSYNTISSTPQSPAKDHGPKPSDGPGGFNKPFPPPFPGNTPSSPYTPGKPQTHQPGQPTPTGSSYQPGQPRPSGTPYQPVQPSTTGSYQPGLSSGTPYQPGQPFGSPNQQGHPRPTGTSFQPGQPSETPYQPSPTGTSFQPGQGYPHQPGQPSESPYQPSPTGTPFQPGQGSPYQPGPSGTSFQPGQPSSSPHQPGQPEHNGASIQPGQPSPTGTPFQPDQPSPSGVPSQPDFPSQQTNYNLPTHPGQNQPSGSEPQDQGAAPGSSCGIRRPGPGGDVAGFAEFPWQAQVLSAGNRSVLCGAAIIAENAVITAAHCVNHLKANDLLVKAGEWKLLGQNPKSVQVRTLAAIARHPGYNSGSLVKDMAILVLGAEPFTLDIHVDKICIPPGLGGEYFQKPGQNCVITGWGKIALSGPIQNSDMHKIDVNVVPAKQCEAKLKTTNLGKYFILNEGFSCALPPSPEDLCKVDFGSAVACERGDGHYELAGVNSWDVSCNQQLPSVFATSDTEWINTVLATPTPVLKAEEDSYNQALFQGENVDGVDIDDKPGFSQGYGK